MHFVMIVWWRVGVVVSLFLAIIAIHCCQGLTCCNIGTTDLLFGLNYLIFFFKYIEINVTTNFYSVSPSITLEKKLVSGFRDKDLNLNMNIRVCVFFQFVSILNEVMRQIRIIPSIYFYTIIITF